MIDFSSFSATFWYSSDFPDSCERRYHLIFPTLTSITMMKHSQPLFLNLFRPLLYPHLTGIGELWNRWHCIQIYIKGFMWNHKHKSREIITYECKLSSLYRHSFLSTYFLNLFLLFTLFTLFILLYSLHFLPFFLVFPGTLLFFPCLLPFLFDDPLRAFLYFLCQIYFTFLRFHWPAHHFFFKFLQRLIFLNLRFLLLKDTFLLTDQKTLLINWLAKWFLILFMF